MTKHGGRYYLQYGAPGTEYNVYATGTYVADDPLGPFTYAPYNPVAYKPGGFVQGAGHGNTFQDVHGNWWNTGTPWIGVNWNFERRIGLHPAGFDADGQLHVDTRFGDFPHWLPTKAHAVERRAVHRLDAAVVQQAGDGVVGARQLPASSRSPTRTRAPSGSRATTGPASGSPSTSAARCDIRAIQVNYADYKSGLYGTDSTYVTRFRLRASRRRAELAHRRRPLARDARPAERVRRARVADARALRPLRARVTSARRISRSATFACSATVAARGRRRRPASRRAATATSAMRRSHGSRCRRRSATTCAGESRRRSCTRRTSASPTRGRRSSCAR